MNPARCRMHEREPINGIWLHGDRERQELVHGRKGDGNIVLLSLQAFVIVVVLLAVMRMA